MTLGDNIKSYRVRNDMLQGELAKKLGVSKQTISSWETNRTEPNIGAIEKMSQLFNCSKLDIIGQDYVVKLETASNDETMLLKEFRKADKETQSLVRRLLHYAQFFEVQQNESNKTE